MEDYILVIKEGNKNLRGVQFQDDIEARCVAAVLGGSLYTYYSNTKTGKEYMIEGCHHTEEKEEEDVAILGYVVFSNVNKPSKTFYEGTQIESEHFVEVIYKAESVIVLS